MIMDVTATFCHMMVHTIHPTGNYEFSTGWEEFTGCSASELQYRWLEYVAEADREELNALWSSTQSQHKPHQGVFKVRRADGEYRSLLIDMQPIDPSGVMAISIDVHDREEKINRKLDRYHLVKLVVHSLHALIAYVDSSQRYVFVNRAYEDLYNLPLEQIQGRLVKELLGEDTYKRVEPYISRALGGESVELEEEIYPPTGDCKHIHISLVPHFADGKKVSGMFILGNPVEPGSTANSRFEDLERFLSFWKGSPQDFIYFVGRAIGRIAPTKLYDLCLAIGSSYFAYQNMCDRIDFLYDSYKGPETVVVQDGFTRNAIAQIKMEDDVLCLHDLSNKLHGTHLMLLRDVLDGLPYYSIRYFVTDKKIAGYLKRVWLSDWGKPLFKTVSSRLSGDEPQFEEDHIFWNFRRPENPMHGVIVYPHAESFHELWETKHLGDFLVLVSNLKNFERKLS